MKKTYYLGPKKAPEKERKQLVSRWLELRNQGHGVHAAAKLVGVSFMTLYNWKSDLDERPNKIVGKPCFNCGELAEYDHHVVPNSRGGKKKVPLCGICHAKAHHMNKNMTIATMVKETLARKKANNQYTGKIPYGYDLADNGNDLIENEEEKQVLDQVWEMRLAGLSYSKICDDLNSRGIKPKNSKRWSRGSLRGIMLRNVPSEAAVVESEKQEERVKTLKHLLEQIRKAPTDNEELFCSLFSGTMNALEMSSKESAREFGVGRTTISRWIRKENAPHPAMRKPIFVMLERWVVDWLRKQK